ncbi:hypothetical protein ACWT_4164 [Actinoplanes sp. SE50]|uniref:DUF6204 family protein n=1 Tax=unclassified Actinoplanes TaxID=2626549 RepID=UPI00023EC101|nr:MULTISPECIES: DUF6204 family protein [unclassified Actinoplanes]AEV85184.1 hypothetical protein ACPL_4293 [Actinoplanes sp. SE50/110]ATO83579.1 hypothetical protein ACWT_4164 [Actinoplanes sp. SE50]SLM00986.1 hypothetical protein ACSP50_4219 [Actinoplanes sp. SE50/110]
MSQTRTIRVTVRGSFDNLTDKQKTELTANGGDDLLTAQYTEQGHLTYDIAARPFFTFRFAEQVTEEKEIPQAAINAEMKAVAWLEEHGYGYKKITSQTVDMSEVPLGKRGRREAAKS